jgi:hypothetical protein
LLQLGINSDVVEEKTHEPQVKCKLLDGNETGLRSYLDSPFSDYIFIIYSITYQAKVDMQ